MHIIMTSFIYSSEILRIFNKNFVDNANSNPIVKNVTSVTKRFATSNGIVYLGFMFAILSLVTLKEILYVSYKYVI